MQNVYTSLQTPKTKFNGYHVMKPFFWKLKDKFCHYVANAIPNTGYPFHIHADSLNVGTGCILIQAFPDGKRIVSANSRVFDKAEQKISPQHRELCGFRSALQTYEFYFLG